MSTNTSTKEATLFKNTDLAEAEIFEARIAASIRKNLGASQYKVFDKGPKTTGDKELNAQCYDEIVLNIHPEKCQTLIRTLHKKFKDRGHEAMKYIISQHATNGNAGKEQIAAKAYKNLAANGIKDGLTVQDWQNTYNEMESLRAQLDGTARAVSDEHFINDLTDMIKEHSEYELQYEMSGLNVSDGDVWTDPAKHSDFIEGVIAIINSKRENKAQREKVRALQSRVGADGVVNLVPPSANTNTEWLVPVVQAMADGSLTPALLQQAMANTTGNPRTPCDACGVVGHDAEECMAKQIADGKTPDKFDELDEEKQSRIKGRADDIRRLGMHKDRRSWGRGKGKGGGGRRGGNGRGGGNNSNNVATILSMLAHMGQINSGSGTSQVQMPASTALAMAANMLPPCVNQSNPVYVAPKLMALATGVKDQNKLLMDSGNISADGKSYHIITNRDLFDNLDTSVHVPVVVADKGIAWSWHMQNDGQRIRWLADIAHPQRLSVSAGLRCKPRLHQGCVGTGRAHSI